MRTPGLGERRLSSTSGVLPIASTMSPYLPPHGRFWRPGSIITSESVAPSSASAEQQSADGHPDVAAAVHRTDSKPDADAVEAAQRAARLGRQPHPEVDGGGAGGAQALASHEQVAGPPDLLGRAGAPLDEELGANGG